MNHSPEPWTIGHSDWDAEPSDQPCRIEDAQFIFAADGEHVVSPDYVSDVDRKNWPRITACVNYCKGVPTDELIRLTHENKPLIELVRRMHEVQKGSVEMKEALDELRAELQTITGELP